MPVFPAIFIGVLQKILNHSGHESRIKVRLDAGLYIRLQAYAAAVMGHELPTAGLHKNAQVRAAHGIAVGAVLYAGEAQELLHQLGHMLPLLLNHGDGGQKILWALVFPFGPVAFGQNDGYGRAQLMGGIGGNASRR